uniref:Sex-determining region Y protein n=1 Tax=Parastrongyloides trichosuri TaxID=131310 RepID=A0A0N4Z701_PARTI
MSTEDVTPQIGNSPTSITNEGSSTSTGASASGTPCYDSEHTLSNEQTSILPNTDAVPTPPLSEEHESSYDMESLENEIGLPGVEMLSGGNGSDQQFIKRPLNAYMIFTRVERKKIMAQDPKKKMFEVSREMGERWKALSDLQKKPFFDLAKKHKELHQSYLKQNPDIAYHPQRKKTSKNGGSNGKGQQPPTPDYNAMPVKTISPNNHIMQQQQTQQPQYTHHMSNGTTIQGNGVQQQQQPPNNNNLYQGNNQQVHPNVCTSTFYIPQQHMSQNGMQQIQMMPQQGNGNSDMMLGYYGQLYPNQVVENGGQSVLGMSNNGYFYDGLYNINHTNGTG